MTNPPLDFDSIAEHAVAAGLFEIDTAAAEANLLVRRYSKLPVTLLDGPYGNGPVAIRVLQEDVPEASVDAVRRNFMAANEILLPLEQTLRYFDQRFVADDVLQSGSMRILVDEYQAPRVDEYHEANVDAVLGTRFKPSALSFQVDGVDRTTHNRRLYTREEHIEGLRLAQRHPEVVLAILAYQSVLQDYFQSLRGAFARLARHPGISITAKDLVDFDDYARQWRSNNFTAELVPAAAIFYKPRFDAGERTIIDEQLLQRAVDFIVANGAFRNWVTVPARIALDHKERVTHFLCPAVGAVREQLLDGQLLLAIYALVRRRVRQKDRTVRLSAQHIRSEAREKFRSRNLRPDDQQLDRLQEGVRVALADGIHDIQVDATLAVFMSGREQPGDAVLEAPLGTWLYDMLKAAVSASAEWHSAIFFSFNGRGYRVTPEKLQQFVARPPLQR